MQSLWPPRYLARWHAKFEEKFRQTPFTFSQLVGSFNDSNTNLAVILSRLRQKKMVIRIRDTKPKQYIVLPIEFSQFYVIDEVLGGLVAEIKQERFVPIVTSLWQTVRQTDAFSTWSVGIFGSAVRGDATATSDLDVLVLAENLPKNVLERCKLIMPIELALESYLNLLGMDVEFLVLRPEELS
ncbi:MAG TPA: nucleotidyltransferase domain-containing protein, partial [Candidatus Hodarchaeales archaeon]|nr:nucleotidyltransferase domain-containing protein [Candidatus Hodarchaeales archaeon]